MKKTVIFHPFLLAIFPIIFLFSHNVNNIYAEEVILPLLYAISGTFLIWIVLGFILKSRIKAGFVVSLGLIVFFSYGHIFMLLNTYFPMEDIKQDFLSYHLILFIPVLVLFAFGSYYFIRTKRPLNNATKIVNFIAASLVVISFVGIGEYYITESYSLNQIQNIPKESSVQITESNKFPDVYYIILDAYAGSLSLQKMENYDNSDFLDFLSKKGFHIASESFSNYQGTRFSIPSTLHMNYIQNTVDIKNIDLTDGRALIEVSRDNPVFKNFKSKGYIIYSIESGSVHTTNMNNVDFRLCTNEDTASQSEFDSLLIETTILNPIQTKLFSDANREKILCGFSELLHMKNNNDTPKFVFAHIMLPHRPYVFGPTGEPIDSGSLALRDDGIQKWNAEHYIGQLEFANLKMKELIEKLTETENSSIIIIQSDHGMRKGGYNNGYEFVLRNFNNFKAYNFPDGERNIDFETTTPVNSFRILFNLLGDEHDLLEDKLYVVSKEGDQFKDVTEARKKPNPSNLLD